jgi:hypothetical protein
MASQTGKNIVVAYKVQPTAGTAPGTGTAKQLRIDASPGMSLKRTLINNAEVRSDGLSSMPRLGSRMADGTYNVPITVGGLDDLLEAVMRSTWVAATPITVDAGAALTSFTVNSTSSFTLAGTTTPIVAGLRVGDVGRFSNMSTAANNAVNVRIKSIAAGLVTVHGTPLTVQSADTAATFTIMKKLKNATTPTKRAFYVEEYNQDIDVSEVFDYCKVVQLKITGSPDGSATAEVAFLGLNGTTLASGSSPYFISPTLGTAIRLVYTDASVSYNGADVLNCTGFEITLAITAATQPVVGGTTSPDVFDNDCTLTGSLSFIRADLANVALFVAETELELHIVLVEPESEPKDCLAIYVPRVKLTAADADLGSDGAMIETLPFVTGKKEGFSSTGYDDTLLTISTSAA